MTNAQTEARAIDAAVIEAINALRMEQPGRAYDILVEVLATALAAKDAELAEAKLESNRRLLRFEEEHRRAERAEAGERDAMRRTDDAINAANKVIRQRDEARAQLAVYRESSIHPDDYEAVKAQLAEAHEELSVLRANQIAHIEVRARLTAQLAEANRALDMVMALAEAEHVCLVSWNGSGSGMNYDSIMTIARRAREAQGGENG